MSQSCPLVELSRELYTESQTAISESKVSVRLFKLCWRLLLKSFPDFSGVSKTKIAKPRLFNAWIAGVGGLGCSVSY